MDNEREKTAPDQCSRKLDPNDSSAGPPSTSTELLCRQSASCCPFARQSPPSVLAQPTGPLGPPVHQQQSEQISKLNLYYCPPNHQSLRTYLMAILSRPAPKV